METGISRTFLVHYRYNGMEGIQTFTTTRKMNIETFRWLVRRWYADEDDNLQTIIYSWSLIEE